ncbi:MAG: copper resistance protein B [Pseudomonadota bacterium]|nr:copper resistance protein B [Pseudomonadota bacterium]
MKINTFYKLPGLVILGIVINITMLNQYVYAGMMDEPIVTKFTMDKLEISNAENNPQKWELDFWVMKDIQRILFKSEGETVDGETESENMLLYGHGIAPYWDIQFGLAHDTHEEESHSWGVIGLSGIAPYFFETDVHALVDSEGHVGLRANTEIELLITQRLILVPELEAEAYSADIPKMKIGSGLSSLALGLRLKYEFKREFAPYIGIEWHKKYGNTADFSTEDEEASLVAGVSFWF